MDLHFATTRYDASVVLAVTGEIDHHTARSLGERIDAVLAETPDPHLIIDMRGVTFLDSSGLGTLVAARKRVTAGSGVLELAHVAPNVRRIFTLTRMDQTFGLDDAALDDDRVRSGAGATGPS